MRRYQVVNYVGRAIERQKLAAMLLPALEHLSSELIAYQRNAELDLWLLTAAALWSSGTEAFAHLESDGISIVWLLAKAFESETVGPSASAGRCICGRVSKTARLGKGGIASVAVLAGAWAHRTSFRGLCWLSVGVLSERMKSLRPLVWKGHGALLSQYCSSHVRTDQ